MNKKITENIARELAVSRKNSIEEGLHLFYGIVKGSKREFFEPIILSDAELKGITKIYGANCTIYCLHKGASRV